MTIPLWVLLGFAGWTLVVLFETIGARNGLTSEMGHEQTLSRDRSMSAFPPTTDIHRRPQSYQSFRSRGSTFPRA
jgi:hypothetical protein